MTDVKRGKSKVFIVGGTSGIGLATAKYLSSKCYDVAVGGRLKPEGIEDISFHKIDVREEKSVKECFKRISRHWKALDCLIYSAGITTPKIHISDFDVSNWENLFSTNVTGAIICLKYSYPLLKAARGRVAIINSVAGRTYSKLSGFEYTVSKSALSGLVRQLSTEWAQEGILINSLYPSMTRTPMLDKNVRQEVLEEICETIPLGRLSETEEIAKALEFLVSKSNSYMTGCGLDLNGGLFLNG